MLLVELTQSLQTNMNLPDERIRQSLTPGEHALNTGPGSDDGQPLASRGRRLFAWLIDSLILALIDRWMLSRILSADTELSSAAFGDVVAGSFLIMLIYYVPLEALHGRTIGKFALGIQVVDKKGGKAGFLSIALRTICRVIPLEAITIFFSDQRRCLHDMLGGTLVVKRQ